MRVLVTGGAGFIGSTYVRHLLATTEHHVTVLDALTYAGNTANLPPHPRLQIVVGDVTDRAVVARCMSGHQLVVHFAAETHVDRSILRADEFVRTNVVGTGVVCATAVECGVDRLVHVSTDEVYGSRASGSAIETDPLRPSSPYAATKASADLLALAHHETHGLDVVVVRSTNQYGPHQFPEKLIPYFVTRLLCGASVPLHGDGSSVRDWLHVDDCCTALDVVAASGRAGAVYNVASGTELRTSTVTSAILDTLGLGPERIVHVACRPGHDERYSVDTTRLRSLGWAPRVEAGPALVDTVRWYVDHPHWWHPLLGEVERLRRRLDDAGLFRPLDATTASHR